MIDEVLASTVADIAARVVIFMKELDGLLRLEVFTARHI